MTRVLLPVLVFALTTSACGLSSTVAPTILPATLEMPPAQARPDITAPEGWEVFRSDEAGFGFAYPVSGSRTAGEGATLATIDFPADPATNVVQEVISVSAAEGAGACASPLAEGWATDELAPQTVEVNGVAFLRQTRSGVAAGTATVRVAYTTQREGRCVSLGYELRTFDPANLDPTRFPTPPVSVDWQARVEGFEAIVSTFVWLR